MVGKQALSQAGLHPAVQACPEVCLQRMLAFVSARVAMQILRVQLCQPCGSHMVLLSKLSYQEEFIGDADPHIRDEVNRVRSI